MLPSFQEHLAELPIGEPFPVYCNEEGEYIDKATYLVRVGDNNWGRLGYNGKPHRKHLADHNEPMTSAHLQACCEAGNFYVPDQGKVTQVRLRYDEYLDMHEAYGKKPPAKEQAQEDDSVEEEDEESVEEEARTSAQLMITRFKAPELDDVMETVWMQIFNGTTLCPLKV